MTLEDLEKQVEFMTKRFQDSMKSFDEGNQILKQTQCDIQYISDKTNNNSKINNHLVKDVFEISENLEKIKKEIDDHFQDLSEIIQVISKEVTSVNKSITSVKDDTFSFSSRHDQLEEKIKSFHFLKSDEVKPLYIEIDNINIRASDLSDNVLSSLSSLSSKVADMRQEMMPLPGDIQNIHSLLDNHSSSFSNINAKVNDLKADSINQKNRLLAYFEDSINQKISEIPKNQSISEDQVKDLVNSLCQSSILDAKNANLRSINLENKILILEKKLESVTLMLNKLTQG